MQFLGNIFGHKKRGKKVDESREGRDTFFCKNRRAARRLDEGVEEQEKTHAQEK